MERETLTWGEVVPGDVVIWAGNTGPFMLIYRNEDFSKSVWWDLRTGKMWENGTRRPVDRIVAGSITVFNKQDAWY